MISKAHLKAIKSLSERTTKLEHDLWAYEQTEYGYEVYEAVHRAKAQMLEAVMLAERSRQRAIAAHLEPQST